MERQLCEFSESLTMIHGVIVVNDCVTETPKVGDVVFIEDIFRNEDYFIKCVVDHDTDLSEQIKRNRVHHTRMGAIFFCRARLGKWN